MQHEDRPVDQHVFHDADVGQAIVEQPIPVPIVRVVEEDQVSGSRHPPAMQPAVAVDVPPDRMYAVVLGRGVHVQVDSRGRVGAADERGTVEPFPSTALPQLCPRGGQGPEDGIPRRRLGGRARRRRLLHGRRRNRRLRDRDRDRFGLRRFPLFGTGRSAGRREREHPRGEGPAQVLMARRPHPEPSGLQGECQQGNGGHGVRARGTIPHTRRLMSYRLASLRS